MSKTLTRAAALAALTVLVPVDALACGGSPPQPTCGKTLTMGKAINRVRLANNAPIVLPVPVGIWLGMSPPAGSPGSACPAGPIPATLTLTATCNTGAGGGTVVMPVLLNQNAWNNAAYNLPIAAGGPRRCTIRGTVTSTCATGVGIITARARGDAEVCFVEPSPGDPSVPRLDFHQIDIDNNPVPEIDGLDRSHPGDTVDRWYRITNNDPNEAVTVQLDADSNQTARLPDDGSAQPTAGGGGIYAISDPGLADDFPIEFRTLAPCDGCVDLPDPLLSINPTVATTVRLGPGESTVVSLTTRSWGMCANGSCGESNVVLAGTYDGGDPVEVCGTGAHLVDGSSPPSFAWDDAGAISDMFPAPPFLDIVNHAGTFDTQFQVFNPEGQVVLDGQPLIGVPFIPQTELIDPQWGRLHTIIPLPPIPAQQFLIDAIYATQFDPSILNGLNVDVLSPVLGAPAGFELLGPFSTGLISQVTPTGDIALSEVFHQTSLWGVTIVGDWLPIELPFYDTIPLGPDWLVHLEGVFPPTTDPIVELHLLTDLRLFTFPALPPQCEPAPILIIDEMVGGEITNIYVEGAPPGETAIIFYSRVGPGSGPCAPAFPGFCVDILAPRIAFNRTVSPAGLVDVRPLVPPSFQGRNLALQAVILDPAGPYKTDVVIRTVQ